MVARILGQRKSDRKNTIDTVIVRMGFQFKFTRGHKNKTAHLVSKFGIFRGLFLWCNNGNQLQCNINTLAKFSRYFSSPLNHHIVIHLMPKYLGVCLILFVCGAVILDMFRNNCRIKAIMRRSKHKTSRRGWFYRRKKEGNFFQTQSFCFFWCKTSLINPTISALMKLRLQQIEFQEINCLS